MAFAYKPAMRGIRGTVDKQIFHLKNADRCFYLVNRQIGYLKIRLNRQFEENVHLFNGIPKHLKFSNERHICCHELIYDFFV